MWLIPGFFFVVGFLLLAGSEPKSDRRFRTGYKGNAEPNEGMARIGWVCLAIGGILVLLGYLVSAIAHPLLVASQYSLGLTVCLLAYFGLVALIARYFMSTEARDDWKKNPSLAMPSPHEFDWSRERDAIHYHVYLYQEVRRKISAAYAHGKQNGIGIKDTSQGSRFDGRSPEGAKLNRRLDELWAREDSLETKIKATHGEIKEAISNHEWRRKHWELVYHQAGVQSVKIGILAYTLTFLSLLSWNPSWIQYLSSNAWFTIPALQAVYGPAAIAAVVGWVSRSLVSKPIESNFSATMHEDEIAGWNQITADIENAVNLPDDYRPPSRPSEDESTQQQQPNSTTTQGERTWYEVLDVAESATAEEIKSAYRQRMREYHPDSVASRGAKLQDVAAQETLAINLAFKRARQLGKA